MVVRPFEDRDRAAVVGVWARALPLDAVTEADFTRRVLLDKNHDPAGLLVAELDGAVVGFAVCLVLRHPIEKVGLIPHRGYITAMGVDPAARGRGVGRALMEAADAFFRSHGRTEVAIAPYAPGYFVPGIDRVAYAEGLAWLQRRGFEEFSEGIAMDAMIGRFELSPELVAREAELAARGIRIEPLGMGRVSEYLQWMSAVMPGDWVEDARRLLGLMATGAAPASAIQVAVDGGRIVGYCKFEGEHFGPFGVAESHQGSGIGTVLLARTLLAMRIEGHHAAYVLWTGERAARGVYARLGFTISRRFAIVRRKLA